MGLDEEGIPAGDFSPEPPPSSRPPFREAAGPPRGSVWPVALLSSLSAFLLAAHFLRAGLWGGLAASLAAPLILLVREAWVPRVLVLLSSLAAALWAATGLRLAAERRAAGEPVARLALIFGAVAVFTLLPAFLASLPRFRSRFTKWAPSAALSSSAFGLTFAPLLAIHLKGPPHMLLLNRFLPGGGLLEALVLGAYAAFIAGRMADRKAQPLWRKRVWTVLSVAVLGQFALGLFGLDRFLMNPERLHPPVPALIVAAPLFRGEGFFMPILFGVTLLLVGPAWCSHLCYIGAWDLRASTARKRPLELPPWTRALRWGLLAAVVCGALILRALGLPGWAAAALGIGFGASGVVLMVLWSRRTGTMAHCTVFCPIGLLANLGGKVSPFRLRIGEMCTDCDACMPACRYGALTLKDIAARRAGFSCTLCGDCLSRCRDGQIGYRFPGLSPGRARNLFLLLAVSTHAVFLGVTML